MARSELRLAEIVCCWNTQFHDSCRLQTINFFLDLPRALPPNTVSWRSFVALWRYNARGR